MTETGCDGCDVAVALRTTSSDSQVLAAEPTNRNSAYFSRASDTVALRIKTCFFAKARKMA